MWFMHDGIISGWGWGWMALGWLWMLLFWGSIIALIVWVVSRLTQRGGSSPDRPSPLEIAQARYARGEITKEEYEQIRRDLRQP